MSFAEAASLIKDDMLSATETRSEDYGGFRRSMGEAAQAQQDIGGVQFAEVAVDIETGIIKVERVVAVQDCGRPMNPLLLESQIQGGVLMGLSYALYENRVLDRATGRILNANLEAYKVAGPQGGPEDRGRGPGKLSGPQRDRRLRHRRARQYRDRARDRQRRLQRDRRPVAVAADDSGGGAGGARQTAGQELTRCATSLSAGLETIAEAASGGGTCRRGDARAGRRRAPGRRASRQGGRDRPDRSHERRPARAGASYKSRAPCPASTQSRRRPRRACGSERWSRSRVWPPIR